MEVTLDFTKDFAGQIKETIPAGFTHLESHSGASAERLDDQTHVYWDVEASAGQSVSLAYGYDAPDISPQFYLLGGLELQDDNGALYTEQRQWQLPTMLVQSFTQLWCLTNHRDICR